MGSFTFFAHKAESIVHCVEVVDDCALMLALLPVPRAVGYPIEVVQCIQVMYAYQAHNLWGL